MSRTADAGMITYLDGQNSYNLAYCYRIVRRDGTIYAYTEHDEDLTIDLGDGYGSIIYRSDTVVENSELQGKTNMGASNIEVSMLLFEDHSISQEDVILGLFDDAVLDIFEARWDVSPVTTIRAMCGLLSTAEVSDNIISINYRSLTGLYDQNIIRTIYRGCSYELGLNGISFHRCFVQLTAPAWTSATAFTARINYDAKTEIGAIVKPTTQNGYWYVTYTGGTSGGTEPTWPTVAGATVADNDITWTAIRARTFDGAVTGVSDNRQFADTSNTFEDDYWVAGYLVWNTGLNTGKKVEITYSKVTGDIKLFERMMQNIQVGDTYTITAGCDGFKTTCKTKFNNVYWFGGFDDAPGVLDLIQTP